MNLKAPCPHGRYEAHEFGTGLVSDNPRLSRYAKINECPGGSLLPPDTLVIVKEDGDWPRWPREVYVYARNRGDSTFTFLDALAAAQEGKET